MSIRSGVLIGVMLAASSVVYGQAPDATENDTAPNEVVSFRGVVVLAGRRSGETNARLFSMKADGTGLKSVWEFPKDSLGRYQRISPQGNRLAVAVGAKDKPVDVWIVNGDGSHQKLVDDAIPVAWSADGHRIACYRQKVRSTRNFFIDLRTKAEDELPLNESEIVQDWSPVRELLCVTALHPDKTFEHPTKGTYPLCEVFLLGVSGMPRVQLRNAPLHDDRWGRFSPDGAQVSFQRRRHKDGEVWHEVIVQGRDGKDPRTVLSFEELRRDWKTYRPQGPACWSPDGKQLATVVIRTDDNGFSSELLMVTLETGDVRRFDLKQLGFENVVWIDWR